MTIDPDADNDAFRVRPDAFMWDAYGLDVSGLDAADDARGPMFDAGFVDDVQGGDAGPIPQCEGNPAPDPSMACRTSDDCVARGMANCMHDYPTGSCSIFAIMLIDECRTDDDCIERFFTDAAPISDEDAATADGDAALEPMDAGPRRDVGVPDLECVVTDPQCPWPVRRCLTRCTGPTCPDARCDADGYMCPMNSMCDPSSLAANQHGCRPLSCATDGDCDCGYCTTAGLCANGAGRCE